jgi:uncharacterized protein (TIGR03435 family)
VKCVSIGLVAFAAAAMAQDGPGFEVVSIKPSSPSATGMRVGIAPGGVFRATNVTLQTLIQQDYDVHDFQISGGPGWMNTQRYDIVAKGSGPGVSEDDLIKMTSEQRNDFQKQMQGRLQALMADRFQLKLHRETKELPVYALIVAKNGSKIRAATDSLTPRLGMNMRRNDQGKTEMTGTQVPLTFLVRSLSNQVGRPVVDRTALAGIYDFKLVFSPDLNDPDGPSIFTAIEEQLGLKLDSQKGPVEVVVIDRAEKASEN